VADDRPVAGWKVTGRAAQGTVPLTETYCEYGADHISVVLRRTNWRSISLIIDMSITLGLAIANG
jgi:hypothetical protein